MGISGLNLQNRQSGSNKSIETRRQKDEVLLDVHHDNAK